MLGRRQWQRRSAVVLSVLAVLVAALGVGTGIAGAASPRSARTERANKPRQPAPKPKPKPKPTTATTKPTTTTTKPTTTTTSDGSTVESAPGTEEHRPQESGDVLRCVAGRPDGVATIYCHWRQTDRPAFGSYRLWREVPGAPHQPVFTTTDRGTTVYVDHDVTEGTPYAYAVEMLDGNGASLGRSNVVKLTCCAPSEGTKPPKESGRPPTESFRCAAGHQDGAPAAYCKWQASDNPAFASYRLWRAEGDAERQVIFTTTDRGTTIAIDRTVMEGKSYRYALEILDKDGKSIGHSEIVRVRCCEPSSTTTSSTTPPTTSTTTGS